jgi:hypothetical protein
VSTSAFSSLVLLMKKVGNTWCFCMDNHELNQRTVKDKFPIPVVDEMLDELCGTRFFTKLDLCNGYHQVQMHLDDIYKMMFFMQRGHFEFLDMPFGLTNVLSTFQALMNDVLQPFIHKFVLVFFDDILVFSKSWSEHLQHVKLVLQALCDNKLTLKRVKCSFGIEKVAYLGHIISAEGVAMDPSKVDVVEAWPHHGPSDCCEAFCGSQDTTTSLLRATARWLLCSLRFSSERRSSGRRKWTQRFSC